MVDSKGFHAELSEADPADSDSVDLITLRDDVAEVEFLFHPSQAPYIAAEILARHTEWLGTGTAPAVELPEIEAKGVADPDQVAEPVPPAAAPAPSSNPFMQ